VGGGGKAKTAYTKARAKTMAEEAPRPGMAQARRRNTSTTKKWLMASLEETSLEQGGKKQ